jgi:DNA-binding helix-hairpin-helix protein with protein kinase domain
MITDERGRPIALGPAIASGGEGAIHTVTGEPSLLAKVYNKAPSKQTGEKLRLMLTLATPGVRSIAAWPNGILLQNGTVVGFLMPKLDKYEPIQHLYNPAQRLKYFARFGWRFVVHAARNCAAAFDEVHKTGCLVGDVNQSNILINTKAEVRLIDCDSFQVSASGRDYLCEVGVAHYTPPELQEQNLRSVVRTTNHDRFGLAVLLFQFLFVGRHPYAGVYLGRGDLAFEDAIHDFRFAYGPRCRSVQMEPPPLTPIITDIQPELANLFCKAFERGSERHNIRPTAIEWFNALGELIKQIKTCPADPGHEYWGGAGQCVWCRIANAKGPDYFFGVGDSSTSFTVDEEKLVSYLKRLKAARLVEFSYERKSYKPTEVPEPDKPPENLETHRVMTVALAVVTAFGIILMLAGFFSRFALLTGLLVALVFGIWLSLTVMNSPYRRELNRRRSARRTALWSLERLESEWEEIIRKYRSCHQAINFKINGSANHCRQLLQEYQMELNSLEARREELARAQFLKTCFISDADIPNIKEGRKQTLGAYNILTAYDVSLDSVTRIKGFGQKLAGSLVTWRQQVVSKFRFDKSKGVPEADLRGLATKYRKQQEALFRDIEQSLCEITGLEPKVRKGLDALVPKLRDAMADWWQADCDLKILEQ